MCVCVCVAPEIFQYGFSNTNIYIVINMFHQILHVTHNHKSDLCTVTCPTCHAHWTRPCGMSPINSSEYVYIL